MKNFVKKAFLDTDYGQIFYQKYRTSPPTPLLIKERGDYFDTS